MFRILTSAQYDAICDIVTEKDRVIETQKAIIADLKESIAERDRQLYGFRKANLSSMYGSFHDIDFPATTKQPEDKIY